MITLITLFSISYGVVGVAVYKMMAEFLTDNTQIDLELRKVFSIFGFLFWPLCALGFLLFGICLVGHDFVKMIHKKA